MKLRDGVIWLAIAGYTVFAWQVTVTTTVAVPVPQSTQQVLSATSFSYPELANQPSKNDLLTKTNNLRDSHRLTALSANEFLSQQAQRRADEIAASKQYAHLNVAGKYFYDDWENTQFANNFGCENLGLAEATQSSVYIEQWLNSDSGHRECLLNNTISSVGYGVAKMATSSNQPPHFVVVAIHASN